MKIGIFTECYKPIINGVVNSIIGFKTGLEALGHEVYIFCPTYKHYTDDKSDKNIIHCKSWPLPGKSGYHFIFAFSQQIKDIASNMDIIHVQHPFIMGDRAAKLAHELGKPFVFTNHTQYDQYAHYIPFSKHFVIDQIINYIKKFSKKIDLIIAPAIGIEKKLRSYGVKTPIKIVPNGIDVKNFQKKIDDKILSNLRQKHNIGSNDTVLIFTGRIADEKNLDFLIRAYKLVNQKIQNTKLLLVGGGPSIEKYNDLAKNLGVDNDVIITDYVPYHDINAYLSLAKIYITASKSEVHPLTIIEGLAAGLPMVIVNAPGTGDIITNNKEGFVCKDDIDNFSQKVYELLNNKTIYNKFSNNAKITANKYSYLETSKTMEKVYKQLINRSLKSTQNERISH